MLTRSAILATILTVGLVAGVGTSALAVAFVPGNQSGSAQRVEAIASTSQDPAVGASATFLNGEPAIVNVPIIAVDGQSDERDATASPGVASEPPAPTEEPVSGDSGTTAEDKAADKQAKKDEKAAEEQAKKDEKAAEEQAKKEKKAAEEQAKKDKKAAEEQAKKDKKAAEEQAKKDKKDKKDSENSADETAE